MLVERTGNALRLVSASPVAAGMGLAAGLTLADARARVPGLVARPADPAADAALLGRLAGWCDRFTPLVATRGADGLVLDITGCAGLFGGEAALRREAAIRLKRFGFTTRAAIAGTPEAAGAIAQFGAPGIVPPGEDERAVATLPVAALEADADAARALRRAGLRTIGDLAQRPSANLTARFGKALTIRLRRLCGRENARFTPLRPPPQCRAVRRFAEPLMEAAALGGVIGDLLGEAVAELGRREEGGRAFEACFFRTDGEVRRITVETGRPSREAAAILKLFEARMAALADPIDPGFGFDSAQLSVLRAEKLAAQQTDFERRGADEAAVAALIDRLTARFGRDRVQRFAPRDTHDPEREARVVAAAETGPQEGWIRPQPGEPPLRPLQLFTPPHPIEVPAAPVPDGPPRRFRWRRIMHDVVAVEGPERIAPAWWRSGGETLTRDYYRVEDEAGRRFWIYRRGLYGRETDRPEWYLHGLFA